MPIRPDLGALCQKCHNGYDAGKGNADRKRMTYEAAGQLVLFENYMSSERA